jgi:hypothetical protein
MSSRSHSLPIVTVLACVLAGGLAGPARASSGWLDPPSAAMVPSMDDPAATASTQPPTPARSVTRATTNARVARDFAFGYLNLWSAPNRVALATVKSYYGPTVTYHGRTRTIESVLAEKQRFAARWPERNYRHRPETTRIWCDDGTSQCTIWALFDFSATDTRRNRRSRGIGEHEIVVHLSQEGPIITSETSRVLYRGAVQR